MGAYAETGPLRRVLQMILSAKLMSVQENSSVKFQKLDKEFSFKFQKLKVTVSHITEMLLWSSTAIFPAFPTAIPKRLTPGEAEVTVMKRSHCLVA